LHVVFCWSAKVPPKSAEVIADVCINSVCQCQWYQLLREKCSEALLNDPNYVFGGNGDIVQIDESVVVKRIYNDGCAVDQQWIFALYDRNTKLGYIELVNDRSAQTLIPIIQKFIRPGTTIFSNQWPAYRQLHNLGYDHKTVNHSENFRNMHHHY